MTDPVERRVRLPGWAPVVLVVLLLAGLPAAVWLDLRNISEHALLLQAENLNSLLTTVRNYYADNVVERVLATEGHSEVVHNYREVPGAIPIPATLSLELAGVVGTRQSNIAYRFVSDFPFRGRAPHALDSFERAALATLRANPAQTVTDVSWSGLTGQVRLVAPVTMGEACVGCHNGHPDSPKRDWRAGDVRGLQEIAVTVSAGANILSFKYLLSYFTLMAVLGFSFIALERRLNRVIAAMNRRLESANELLSSIADKISRYLPPQIYSRIFSGQTDVRIQTERKKLSIFFSDIKDFTALTDRLQPEEVTRLLNEYLTEMSRIADRHGGTVDKFIGDAMVVFFGDPESRGVEADAQACLAMAVEMQRRLAALNAEWRRRGILTPFQVRMGINTGYCDVGNFGSEDRMEYTIIGVEANLAARLQSIAEPGQIVMSSETYAVVRERAAARPLPAFAVKGISREIVPYVLDNVLAEGVPRPSAFSQHTTGLDLYLDPDAVAARDLPEVRRLLADALAALDRRSGPAPS